MTGDAGRSIRARRSWILFDFAQQPFHTLVTTFVFGPYFAAQVAATPTEGQAVWGYATAASGATIAVLAPILGAIADVGGRAKTWIAALSVIYLAGCLTLWLATPEAAPIIVILTAFALANTAAELKIAMTNAMMPGLAAPGRLGRLSGSGWGFGYLGGLISLGLMLAFFVADPETGRTLAGATPVFGLDPSLHEGDRASGPFTAIWYLVFVVPLFLFVPDRPKLAPLAVAVPNGVRTLLSSLKRLPRRGAIFRFLIARMLYQDGLNALFAFGGIYAVGAFGWTTVELGVFGILITVTATVGAFAGGSADDRFGTRAVLVFAISLLLLLGALILSIDRETVLWVVPVSPDGAGLFGSAAERVYILFTLGLGTLLGPIQAASRSMLARLAEPQEMTEMFGLYAFTGKATAFAAPLAVGIVTAATDSQRLGIAAVLVFIAAGLLLLVTVPRLGRP